MSTGHHRVQKIHSSLTRNHKTARQTIRRPQVQVTFQGLASKRGRKVLAVEKEIAPTSVFLVARRPPLSGHPLIWRWLARFVYQRIQWAPDFGIEYQGVYTDASEARHVASGPGMFVIEMPLNSSLPLETCQYGSHDFPLSEASSTYRNRKFPFVAVPRSQIERLQEKLRATDPLVEGMRAKAI
jgi:hypothetical protein